MNNVVHRADGRTPYQTLLDLDATPINVKDFHTFGCPCYILDHRLQSGQGNMPKVESSSSIGYLCWTIAITCIKCWNDTQPTHWPRITTVP